MLLASCGGNDALYGDQTVVDPNTPVASRLIISTDSTTVQSDNSDSATIKVLALDSSNAAVEGVVIDFATTAGVLNAPSGVADANGEVTVTFSAGADPSNQTASITATSGSALPALIPVDIVGSTVVISSPSSNIEIGGTDTTTLTITAANSSGVGVYNTPVVVSIDPSSTGTGTLSNLGGLTDTQGKFTTNLTGTGSGTLHVVATALNITTFFDVTVNTLTGSLLISSPVTGSTVGVNTAGTVVTIQVPTTTTAITLDSTQGTFSAPSAGGSCTGTTCSWTGIAGTVTATLSSTVVGTANIQVEDAANPLINDNVLVYFVNQTVDANSVVSLQASPTTIAPSTLSSQGTSDLTATVGSSGGGVIAGARVAFKLSNTTGSGEYVSPAVAYTDAFGVARATLYSGSQSTSATGLQVTAELDQTLTGTLKSDSVSVIVGGTATSIAIGMSTKIIQLDSNSYAMPITIQVADTNGSPVANQVVNLSLWPVTYALGTYYCYPEPGLWLWGTEANEDTNRDANLDTTPINEDKSGDGALTPAVSYAGTIPSSVTTDENGFATFNLSYLKSSANFVEDALTATTLVLGTETKASARFWLPAAESDVNGCWLGPSPFNTAWPELTATATPGVVAAGNAGFSGGSSTIEATLSINGIRPDGENVTAEIVSAGSKATVVPTIDGVDTTTTPVTKATVAGVVSFTYTAGDQAGTDWVKLTYTTPSGTGISYYVPMIVE